MRRRPGVRGVPAVIAAALLLAACSSGGSDEPKIAATPTTTSTTSTTTTAASSTTTSITPRLPAVPLEDGADVLATSKGFILPIEGGGPGAWQVLTPCGRTATLAGAGATTFGGATVVLDPGHGGVETGAVGANGLVERDLNLAVAEKTKLALEREGATVILTRTGDYRIALVTRGEIAQNLKPSLFISIHHNGGHDEERATPGTEVFFQIASPASKRLAGILYEELYAFFDSLPNDSWYADRDAGAKFRSSASGGDYYGILRRTNGVTAVLSEAAFLSNPAEAALLADPNVQQGEAEAITRAVRRFMLGDDPGSGFTDPYPRTEPAGPGGGTSGCEDPPLE